MKTDTNLANRSGTGVPYRLQAPGTRNAKVILFCFPYSGAGASFYFSWAKAMPASVTVCPVELPGRGRRLCEAPFTRLQPLVESIAADIAPLLDRPFAFFGHSMGALLAYELACRLRAAIRQEPIHLYVSGHEAPHRVRHEAPIHELPDERFIEEVLKLDGTDEAVMAHPELRAIILPTLRADFSACETYRHLPREPLSCPLTALAGRQDPLLQQGDLGAWQELSRGPFRQRLFPGDHFYLNPYRNELLDLLARELTGATEGRPIRSTTASSPTRASG